MILDHKASSLGSLSCSFRVAHPELILLGKENQMGLLTTRLCLLSGFGMTRLSGSDRTELWSTFEICIPCITFAFELVMLFSSSSFERCFYSFPFCCYAYGLLPRYFLPQQLKSSLIHYPIFK